MALRRATRLVLTGLQFVVVATVYTSGKWVYVPLRAALPPEAGQLIENPPKTRSGHRSVPMPRVVADAMLEHLADVPGGPTTSTSAHQCGPVRVASWRSRFWTPATERAGRAPLRAHDLRHTAVALWIAAGASKGDRGRAGRSSVVTVLDRYGHLLPGSEEKVTDALDQLADRLSWDGRGTLARRSAGGPYKTCRDQALVGGR